MPHPDCREHPFDLDLLKRFDPAVVYAMAPSLPASVREGVDHVRKIVEAMGQIEDAFSAYLFAEKNILPEIEAKGIAAITPEQFLAWLDPLHERLAATVYEQEDARAFGLQPGTYADRFIMRWHRTSNEFQLFINMLLKLEQCPSKAKMKDLVEARAAELKLDGDQAIEDYTQQAFEFAALLYKYRDDESVALDDKAQARAEQILAVAGLDKTPKNNRAILAFDKLFYAYHRDDFPVAEKQAVDAMVNVSSPPNKIAAEMQTFAETLLARWRACSTDDVDAAIDIASFVYQEMVHRIHPRADCNGREGTCLLNIVLVSLNYPAIAIRRIDEDLSPTGSFKQAIAGLQRGDDAPLKAHIHACIERAQTPASAAAQPPSMLQQKITLQVLVQRELLRLLAEAGDAKRFYVKVVYMSALGYVDEGLGEVQIHQQVLALLQQVQFGAGGTMLLPRELHANYQQAMEVVKQSTQPASAEGASASGSEASAGAAPGVFKRGFLDGGDTAAKPAVVASTREEDDSANAFPGLATGWLG